MRNLALLALLAACGSDTPMPSGTPDAATPPDGFQSLIANTWTLSPGVQKYLCVRQTVTADTYVAAIRPVSPTGTHHSVLMVGTKDADDGVVECDSSLTKPAIYASGVGTQELDLPDGVAVHLHAGQQLLMNLHLLNASDQPITATSGIDIKPIDPGAVQHEAGVVLAGATNFTIPDGGTTTITGTCTTPAGTTVFAVAPHMHLLGTWMKISYNGTVLHDASYSFDAQHYYMLTPDLVTVANGKLTVACTYDNHTGAAVSYGEHTQDEMCYALSFVYPPPPGDVCVR